MATKDTEVAVSGVARETLLHNLQTRLEASGSVDGLVCPACQKEHFEYPGIVNMPGTSWGNEEGVIKCLVAICTSCFSVMLFAVRGLEEGP